MLGTMDISDVIMANLQSCLAVGGVHPAGAFTFRNNTCIGMSQYGIFASDTWNPASFVMRNNIISAPTQISVDPTPAGAAGDWDSDYNIFYGTGTFSYLGTPYSTLAAYKTAASKDAHSLSTDPNLANYRIGYGSSALHAGIAYTGCIDYRLINCRTPPDVGAYQYGSGSPAAARSALTQPRAARQ